MINYGAPEGGNNDDLASYDLDAHIMDAFGDDTYKVKYNNNEKFKLGSMPSKTLAETQDEKEQRELAEALEQIRQMEEQEKAVKPQE